MSFFHSVSAVRRETSTDITTRRHRHEPVLITEQQVLFSTAAAAGTRAHHNVITMMSHAVTSVTDRWRAHRARPYYPSHYSYLENGLMAREMDRL